MSRPLALLLALSSISALAQSFDCKLAQSPREKAVCADTRLSALDSEIAANYKSLRAQLSPEAADLVQSDQREWLHWIDLVCPAHGKGAAENQTQCLQNQYFTRAHDLQRTAHVGDIVIFPRAHFIYKHGGGPSPNASSVDPGFGYGSLRWPQIDHPNAAQATFNAAVKTKAFKLPVDFFAEKRSTPENATFDTAVDTSGTIDAYFTVDAVNDRLIAISLTDGTYGWGAAHPIADRSSFLWWLDRSRELAAADVFLASSGWQEKLVPLTIASLQSNTEIKDMLWKGDELQKAVQSGISAPTAWTPTHNGLTITFGQYAVGPYVIGMPQAHLTWDDLHPYLEPSLNPFTLPAPIPKQNP